EIAVFVVVDLFPFRTLTLAAFGTALKGMLLGKPLTTAIEIKGRASHVRAAARTCRSILKPLQTGAQFFNHLGLILGRHWRCLLLLGLAKVDQRHKSFARANTLRNQREIGNT